MSASHVEISGEVARKSVDVGSKSERDAVVLNLSGGGHYLLRKAGAPSFGDTSLDSLIGASIKVHGTAVGGTLIMHDWEPIAPTSARSAL